MKKGQLKSIAVWMTIFIIGCFAAYGLTITLNSPSSNAWILNNTVSHGFTVVDQDVKQTIDWCAIYTNNTGSWLKQANYTQITNGTEFIRGLPHIDTTGLTGVWNVLCYNGTHTSFAATNISYGVDGTLPSITLDSPTDNKYQSATLIDLKYTATDASNLEACDIYTNYSGAWAINRTNATVVSGTQDNKTETLSDGVYIWNVECNQTSTDSVWAEDSNRTVIVDSTTPTTVVFYNTNNTVSNDTTPLIRWNTTTETNFEQYELQIATDLAFTNKIQTVVITNRTENSTTLRELKLGDRYYMMVTVSDLADNSVNSSILEYSTDDSIPTIVLKSPTNNSFSDSSVVNFNFTPTDNNLAACYVYLSNSSGENVIINKSITTLTNGTYNNISIPGISDGTYKYNIGCNDTSGQEGNTSTVQLDLTVDTVSPTTPNITSTFHGTNGTDLTPIVTWEQSTETNFDKYVVSAYRLSTNALMDQVNVTTKTTIYAQMTLTADVLYNFSVTAYDKAGNTAEDVNASGTTDYFADSTCGTLQSGWNVCGIVATTARNLSTIGEETGATFVSVWNNTHEWVTCNVGVSTENCDVEVGITGTTVQHVWVYLAASTQWRNRTWSAESTSANISLNNLTTGWNMIGGYFRGGLTYGELNASANFNNNNVTMYSQQYNNGSISVPFVTKAGFNTINKDTVLDYGSAMWVYYNGTGTTTWDVGGW